MLNQCDGCRRNLPKNGLNCHYYFDWKDGNVVYMACKAKKYELKAPPQMYVGDYVKHIMFRDVTAIIVARFTHSYELIVNYSGSYTSRMLMSGKEVYAFYRHCS